MKVHEEERSNKIYIHPDLTPMERQIQKELVATLKRRQAKGEQNLIIVNGKIVVRCRTISRTESVQSHSHNRSIADRLLNKRNEFELLVKELKHILLE